MSLNRFQLIFVICSALNVGAFASATAEVDTPTITMERSVHFLTPNGDDVIVKAGTYHVEAAEAWLRLIPQSEKRAQGLLLQADLSQLDGLLNMPKAESRMVGKDQHLLTLLLPDGKHYEAEGSYSGVRPRGRLPRKNFRKRIPRRPKPSGTLRAKGRPAQITAVTGPHAKLVEQLLATVNCAAPRTSGLSNSRCQKVKADLRKRLKGFRVVGKGRPKQRVNLYLAKGCPAKEDFRRRVAQEVSASVRSHLGPASSKVASRISSLFNRYWQRTSNVLIGTSGTFQSVLITPIKARGVNIATLAGSPCSRGMRLPQSRTVVTAPPPDPTSPPDSSEPPDSTPPSDSTPPPSSTPFAVNPSDYLAHHNEVRANVLPPAPTPLIPLTWNQEIAIVAQNYANQCIFSHNDNRGALGENLYVTSAQPNNLAQQAVQAWASQAPHYDLASNTCASGEICGNYTQIVWAQTSQLGCGAASCPALGNFGGGQGTITICNYSPLGNFNNQRPYESALVTSPPPNTTSTTNSTPLPEAASFPDLASAFLGYHNTVRSSVLPSPMTPLPSFTWNQQMANVAQDWANQCVLGYNAERGPVGENLYVTSSNASDIALQAVQAWVSEAPHFDIASNTCASGEICGHYTQVVWKQTTELGCAIASCPSVENFGGAQATLAVCDYSPRGNFNNQRPYDLN